MTLARGGGIGMPVGVCCCSLADVARKDLRLEQIWPQTRRSYLPADRGRALRAFPIRKSLCSLPATRSALFLLLCYLLADVARNATLPSFLPCWLAMSSTSLYVQAGGGAQKPAFCPWSEHLVIARLESELELRRR